MKPELEATRSLSPARNHFSCPGKEVSKGEFSLSAYYPPEKGLIGRKRHFCQADENLQWLRFNKATAAGNPIADGECLGRLFASQTGCLVVGEDGFQFD